MTENPAICIEAFRSLENREVAATITCIDCKKKEKVRMGRYRRVHEMKLNGTPEHPGIDEKIARVQDKYDLKGVSTLHEASVVCAHLQSRYWGLNTRKEQLEVRRKIKGLAKLAALLKAREKPIMINRCPSCSADYRVSKMSQEDRQKYEEQQIEREKGLTEKSFRELGRLLETAEEGKSLSKDKSQEPEAETAEKIPDAVKTT